MLSSKFVTDDVVAALYTLVGGWVRDEIDERHLSSNLRRWVEIHNIPTITAVKSLVVKMGLEMDADDLKPRRTVHIHGLKLEHKATGCIEFKF
ncbi:hypothetical protein HN358_00565 [Candidatus Uhrbacteria bacterium]|nr:hypothetical protein [Candidatus Uhrbacteria bacterium]MBT7717378.1 hypothetical protein [Candidatus Uhrbacteria bacterium]